MKTLGVALLTGAAVLLSVLGTQDAAWADGGKRRDRSLKAELEGFQEVPVVSTTGSGELRIRVGQDQTSFEYKLTYEDLEGNITQAHIHVAQKNVNGGIVIWLCGTGTNPGPVGTAPCPGLRSGEVTDTVNAANVVAAATQGIAAGDFAEVLDAIRDGFAYANVHTVTSPGGEIRGQIRH